MKNPIRNSVLIAVAALAIAPYFIGLGASSLWDSNEAFYAETPREMIESNDFINPSFNYQPRFNKPPLSYWIVAAFYKAFGVGEATERLAIVLGALLMIAIAYALGRIIYSREAGLLAAIAMAAAPRFLMFSRRIMIDVWVAMFMSAALLLFALAEIYPQKRRTYLALMYGAVGLGVITKGPVAAALPALVFLIYIAVYGRLKKLRKMMLPVGAIIVAAIALPWYAAVYAEHGWQYIETFILKDNLSRYTQPVWGPRRGLLFYAPVMLGDMFPWSVFLLVAAWFAARDNLIGLRARFTKTNNSTAIAESEMGDGSEDESRRRARALPAIWVIVIVVFFSLSSNKEDLYILPIYPAAAAIVGGLIACFMRQENSSSQHQTIRWATAALGLIIAIAGATAIYLFGGAANNYALAGATVTGALAAIGGIAALIAIFIKREFVAIILTALSVIAVNWVFVARTLPDFERFKPVRAMCERIKSEASADAMVGYYRFASPSMAFYLRRHVFEYYEPDNLAAAFASGKEVYCLMAAQDFEAIKDRLKAQLYVLESRPVFQVKLKGILDRVELPQVVLISNKDGANLAQ